MLRKIACLSFVVLSLIFAAPLQAAKKSLPKAAQGKVTAIHKGRPCYLGDDGKWRYFNNHAIKNQEVFEAIQAVHAQIRERAEQADEEELAGSSVALSSSGSEEDAGEEASSELSFDPRDTDVWVRPAKRDGTAKPGVIYVVFAGEDQADFTQPDVYYFDRNMELFDAKGNVVEDADLHHNAEEKIIQALLQSLRDSVVSEEFENVDALLTADGSKIFDEIVQEARKRYDVEKQALELVGSQPEGSDNQPEAPAKPARRCEWLRARFDGLSPENKATVIATGSAVVIFGLYQAASYGLSCWC